MRLIGKRLATLAQGIFVQGIFVQGIFVQGIFVLGIFILGNFVLGNPSLAADPTLRNVGSLSLRVDAELDIQPATEGQLVKWPIVADWDAQGRLVVAECGGVAKPITEHNKQRLHRIVRLIDSNGDGKFDKRLVAADQFAFPEGVLCIGNSILVSAPPEIWKLTDNDGDGICEEREIWFNPGTITGCANDLHGPYLGRDGWIYWCKGAFAEQHHELVNGKRLVTKAAHIFRRRLAGGAVEPVMTGGMDNPVEMAISHTGERFFTSTFLQHPGDGKRDGIAHALYGGVYGKLHDVLLGHPRTGDLLPIMTHLGPAAPSGLICLESERLLGPPAGGIDTLVAAQFNLHKVTAHHLVPRGAGFVTEDRLLVGSEQIDFHPTDIIEAPDGSLLVIDTGGWYNLCCPSSHVDQSIAAGGIYRLTSPTTRRTAAAPVADWDQLSLDQAEQLLGNSQLPLRNRQQALWRVCRLAGQGVAKAPAILIKQLQSSEPSLRQIAAHSISVERITAANAALHKALASESQPAALRAMAEALGRIGSAQSIPALIDKLSLAADDRMLEHSLLYALMELEQPEQLLTFVNDQHSAVRQAVIQVLDQTGQSDRLDSQVLITALLSNDSALSQTAAGVLARHPQRSADSKHSLAQAWNAAGENAQLRTALASLIAAWSQTAEVQQLVAQQLELLTSASTPVTSEQVEQILARLSGVRNQTLPSGWLPGVTALLERSHVDARPAIAKWISGLKLESGDAPRWKTSVLAAIQSTPEPRARLQLLACLSPRTAIDDLDLEQTVVEHFLGDHGLETVPMASAALSRLRLSNISAEHIVEQLDKVQPLELVAAISAASAVHNDGLDVQLMKRLAELPAARTLTLEQVTSLYRNRSESLRKQVQQTVELLGRPSADVEARLDDLLAQLKSGDAARGFQVFRSTKAACSACHRIGYVGGTIGPELTRIGATRSRRALLEAIVFPNARLEQSYTPLRVLTVDGQVYNGLVARQTGSEIELITGANQSITIPTDEIQQQQPSPTSIMPAGLEQQLSLEELADLLTLLEAAGK